MATATADQATTPPTEAEIRAEVTDSGTNWPKDGHTYVEKLQDVIDDWSASLNSAAFDALEATDPRRPDDDSGLAIWRDLRPTEARVLADAIDQAVKRATRRCTEII